MQATTPEQLSDTDRKKILEFLKSHPVGVLATVDEHGDPNASAIYFSVGDNLDVTFTTKRETRKYENIARHNKIMLVAYDSFAQASVQISGSAEEIHDEQEKLNVLEGTVKAADKTAADNVPPVDKYTGGPKVAFRIAIENIWMIAYGGGDSYAKAVKNANKPPSTGDPS